MRALRPLLAVPAGALIALSAAIAWWWAHPPGPASELRRGFRPLDHLERNAVPELGPGVERWRMRSGTGEVATGLWRPAPAMAGQGAWTVVLLGGIGTDDRAALLVPAAVPVSVLAVSWPWSGPRRMGAPEFIAGLPRIRSAALRTPAAIALAIAAARRADPTARVALLGASLGVPPTVAALALGRPDALILVDGAADLSRLLRAEIGRALGGGVASALLAPPAGALAGRLLSALEPARHGREAQGIPVLLIDAADERRYPPGCVARLHATFPHAEVRTHPGGHMRPDRPLQVAVIARTASSWLREVSRSKLTSRERSAGSSGPR